MLSVNDTDSVQSAAYLLARIAWIPWGLVKHNCEWIGPSVITEKWYRWYRWRDHRLVSTAQYIRILLYFDAILKLFMTSAAYYLIADRFNSLYLPGHYRYQMWVISIIGSFRWSAMMQILSCYTGLVFIFEIELQDVLQFRIRSSSDKWTNKCHTMGTTMQLIELKIPKQISLHGCTGHAYGIPGRRLYFVYNIFLQMAVTKEKL